MIALLRGLVAEMDAETIVLDVGGVGYSVTVTISTLRALPPLGGEARLHIYTHAVQDAPWQLFGFVDPTERRVFETLLAVQGVGPRVAIAILSGLPLAELVRAITAGDVGRLTQIRGVGRKIAERMTVELRDKIGATAGGAGGRGSPSSALPGIVPSGRMGELYGALVALGFKPVEFESLLTTLDPAVPVPDLVKQALAALRKR